MKYFEVNWKDGKSTFIRGNDFDEACQFYGIGSTIKSAISSWNECEEMPRDAKQIIIIDIEGEPEYLSGKLSFVQQIRTQLLKNSDKINISVNDVTCNYSVQETPYEFVLKKILK